MIIPINKRCICGKEATKTFTYGYRCKSISLCDNCALHFNRKKKDMEVKKDD